MTTFRLDIHICAGWDGNLFGIADEFDIRHTAEFEATGNSRALNWAADAMTTNAEPGDIGRVYRDEHGDWVLLGEVHR